MVPQKLSPKYSYIVLSDNNPGKLIDKINKHVAMGFEIDMIWYNSKLLGVDYFARLKVLRQNNQSPKILFDIGPVSQVN